MLSFGMLCARAERIELRRRTFAAGSPPPIFAAIVISLASLLKSAPRLTSSAPFSRFTLDHLLCPAMPVDVDQAQSLSTLCPRANREPERLEGERRRGGELTRQL